MTNLLVGLFCEVTKSSPLCKTVAPPLARYLFMPHFICPTYVFGLTPSVARVKMSSEEGQKHIYAQEHQLYYYYNNFKGNTFEQKLKISVKSGHLK